VLVVPERAAMGVQPHEQDKEPPVC
jgi:hypothetical protein